MNIGPDARACNQVPFQPPPSGGETSGAVVEALRIRALAVGPYEAPGQSKAVAIAEQPLSFYLKSGKLGPVDMFERVLDETISASSA